MKDGAISKSRGAIRNVAAIFVAVVVTLMAWFSAADRITMDSPTRNAAHFGGDAAARGAFHALARSDLQNALVEARRAVSTAPVDPAATSAFGSASLGLGRADQAYAAFVVAGALGWRDVSTQLFWLGQGLATGDREIITQRLDALFRLDPGDDAVTNAVLYLERTPLGQTVLAALLEHNPPWKTRFVQSTGNLAGVDLTARMAVIELAAQKGIAFDCVAVGAAANRLIQNDEASRARDLWQRACDRAGDLYLSDGSFELPSSSSNPFDWQLLPKGGLDVDIAPAPAPLHRSALRIASSQTTRTVAARQLAALAPGHYRLSWAAVLDNGRPDDSVAVLVRCNGTGHSITLDSQRRRDRAGRTVTTFVVPESGCPIQNVEVQKAASRPGDTRTGWIDDIRIAPLGSALPIIGAAS